jgi:hypothetical protein
METTKIVGLSALKYNEAQLFLPKSTQNDELFNQMHLLFFLQEQHASFK